MLLVTNVGAMLAVVAIAVGVIISIRLLLLAGRLVRAIEMIAQKPGK